MLDVILITLSSLLSGLRGQAALQAENIALRHQVTALQRTHTKRPALKPGDRCLWVWLSRLWSGWRSALIIVMPETVIGWHRQGFRWYWTWKIRHGKAGRPPVPKQIRDLIRTMSRENPIWGAPRIHSELMKLDIKISEARLPSTWSEAQTTILDVADVPQESRFSTCVRRLLHRPHRLVRSPLRFYCPHTRSTTRRALQRHSSSNGRMDGAANAGSLSV